MYNELVKEKFIRWHTSSEYEQMVCRSLFNQLEEYEEECGADICTRSADDVSAAIERAFSLRKSSINRRLTVINAYIRWCVENGIDGAVDSTDDIFVVGVLSMKKYMVANPAHLQRLLDIRCVPEGMGHADDMLRAFCWLIYSGINEEDAREITIQQVDLSNMVVSYGIVDYEIYKEAKRSIAECKFRDEIFRYYDTKGNPVFNKKEDNGKLLRSRRGVPKITSFRHSLTSECYVKEKQDEFNLSINRIWLSGLFYRKYYNQVAGIPVDFSYEAGVMMRNPVQPGQPKTKRFFDRRSQLEADYETWKLAFYK